MKSMQTLLRHHREIQIPIRLLRYSLWRATGVTSITGYWPELGPLEKIVRRSSPTSLVAPSPRSRILFFTFRAWTTHAIWDALLAHALRLRGADTSFFICGGRLPICDIAAHTIAPPMPCDNCAPYLTRVLSMLHLPYQETRDFISPAERAEIRREIAALRPEDYPQFEFDGLPLGQLVQPSVQWFMLSGSLTPDRETEETYRRFLISGATIARVAGRMLDGLKPDKVYLLNGLFFAERIMIEQARRRGIPFITHEGGFMPDTQVFAHNGFAPYYEMDSVWRSYADRPLTASEERRVDAYLRERGQAKRDVGAYYPSIEADTEVIVQRLGLDRTKPIVTLFTNVDWDTACFAMGAAFESMKHWIVHTIRHFANRPDLELIIRIHPAEVRLPFLEPRTKVVSMIEQDFPVLPGNVHVIPPESDISSYTLMELSKLGLVYTSTTGMELALRGKPVIAAGRGYYADKGFSIDVRSPEEYDELLRRTDSFEPLSQQKIDLARRYACLFFFRHHLPFPLTTTKQGQIHFNFETLDALQPGREPYLDLLCDAILYNKPFVYTGAL